MAVRTFLAIAFTRAFSASGSVSSGSSPLPNASTWPLESITDSM